MLEQKENDFYDDYKFHLFPSHPLYCTILSCKADRQVAPHPMVAHRYVPPRTSSSPQFRLCVVEHVMQKRTAKIKFMNLQLSHNLGFSPLRRRSCSSRTAPASSRYRPRCRRRAGCGRATPRRLWTHSRTCAAAAGPCCQESCGHT